jgi:hypothetical protein
VALRLREAARTAGTRLAERSRRLIRDLRARRGASRR